MAKSGAQLRGLAQFQRRVKNLARTIPIQVGNAMYEEFDEVEKPESMKKTPVQYGDLRDSHDTVGPIIKKDSIRVEIRVGGGGVDYEVTVHEDMEAFHADGEAKFLESTLKESAPFILRRVAARVKLKVE